LVRGGTNSSRVGIARPSPAAAAYSECQEAAVSRRSCVRYTALAPSASWREFGHAIDQDPTTVRCSLDRVAGRGPQALIREVSSPICPATRRRDQCRSKWLYCPRPVPQPCSAAVAGGLRREARHTKRKVRSRTPSEAPCHGGFPSQWESAPASTS